MMAGLQFHSIRLSQTSNYLKKASKL